MKLIHIKINTCPSFCSSIPKQNQHKPTFLIHQYLSWGPSYGGIGWEMYTVTDTSPVYLLLPHHTLQYLTKKSSQSIHTLKAHRWFQSFSLPDIVSSLMIIKKRGYVGRKGIQVRKHKAGLSYYNSFLYQISIFKNWYICLWSIYASTSSTYRIYAKSTNIRQYTLYKWIYVNVMHMKYRPFWKY